MGQAHQAPRPSSYGAAIPSASAGPAFADHPFTLGVASGEPSPNGIVLWTRLAPDPLNGGGLGDAGYLVRFHGRIDQLDRQRVAPRSPPSRSRTERPARSG